MTSYDCQTDKCFTLLDIDAPEIWDMIGSYFYDSEKIQLKIELDASDKSGKSIDENHKRALSLIYDSECPQFSIYTPFYDVDRKDRAELHFEHFANRNIKNMKKFEFVGKRDTLRISVPDLLTIMSRLTELTSLMINYLEFKSYEEIKLFLAALENMKQLRKINLLSCGICMPYASSNPSEFLELFKNATPCDLSGILVKHFQISEGCNRIDCGFVCDRLYQCLVLRTLSKMKHIEELSLDIMMTNLFNIMAKEMIDNNFPFHKIQKLYLSWDRRLYCQECSKFHFHLFDCKEPRDREECMGNLKILVEKCVNLRQLVLRINGIATVEDIIFTFPISAFKNYNFELDLFGNWSEQSKLEILRKHFSAIPGVKLILT